jgi:hypothetical protein
MPTLPPLNELQTATLLAAMDRIVPADDYPAASEAGVGTFIAKLLMTDLSDRAAAFAAGLDALNAEAIAAGGSAFAKLSGDRQDAVLRAVETSDSPAARAFFASLVQLVTEGYYTDPSTGGNRDAVSWRMIGYDPRVPAAT